MTVISASKEDWRNNFKKLINPIFVLGLLSTIFFLYLVFRNTGLYPSVFADSYIYSKFSRLLPLAESPIPGYIYLKLFSITNYCGDGFFGCVKLLNAIFFIAAVPFIFLISRNVTSPKIAAAISFLTIAGPINSYTAYFMPESLFFFSFWLFCWYLLSLDSHSKFSHWLIVGLIYGLTALVKPHAILFAPAIFAYILIIFFKDKKLELKNSCKAILLFIAAGIATKFSVGYIFAGQIGITFFGAFYGNIATSTAVDKYSFGFLELISTNLYGHLAGLVLMYGLPLSVSFAVAWDYIFKRADSKQQKENEQNTYLVRLVIFGLLVVFNLIFVAAIFTATVVHLSPNESIYRLHMRYYNFALPIFYIVAAGALTTAIKVSKNLRLILAACFIGSIFYLVKNYFSPFEPEYVASPELYGLAANPVAFRVVGGLMAATLVIWLLSERMSYTLYLYLVIPFFLVISTYQVMIQLNVRKHPDAFDKAGMFAKQYLHKQELNKLVVVGVDAAALYRSLFYIDSPKATYEIRTNKSPFSLFEIPSNKEWILLIGDYDVRGEALSQVHLNGFSLIKNSKKNRINFSQGVWPDLKVSGLSFAESWGSWSTSDTVRIDFDKPLPREFKMYLTASAFGPNKNEFFKVSVGNGIEHQFKLPDKNNIVILDLGNVNKSHFITIRVPIPTSPKSLGLSQDDRNLGIGMIEMMIVDSKE